MKSRIEGYDLARCVAIFAMVLVNFKLVMSATTGSIWLVSFVESLQGRAVATFIVLAGVGITLFTRVNRKKHTIEQVRSLRIGLLKRALVLIGVGLSYSTVWPADILHFYGFYFLFGAYLFTASTRQLWGAAGVFILISVLLHFFFDYTTGWDFTTLAYHDFWTARGMIRHIFFNGFHPVFPWTAFLLIGMWLGRQNILTDAVRHKIFIIALLTWGATELFSHLLISVGSNGLLGLSMEDADMVFGTGPMPPMPLYVIAGSSFAICGILACVSLAKTCGDALWLQPLLRTGRMSLSLYVLHVILGMGTLEAIGRLSHQTIETAYISAILFNIVGVMVAHFWLSSFDSGPLEWVFRKIAE